MGARRSGRRVHVRLSRSRLQLAPVHADRGADSRVPTGPADAPLYRSDLIVRAEAPLSDAGGHFRRPRRLDGRATRSPGFNAFRQRAAGSSHSRSDRRCIGRWSGELITARNVLDGVREGRIDIGPLDAYWHMLISRHAPELTTGTRTLMSTPLTPIPAFVAARDAPAQMVERLRASFVGAAAQTWFRPFGEALLLDGFAPVREDFYAPLLEWDRQAQAAGYPLPA